MLLRLLSRLLVPLALGAVCASSATAQLDLPSKPPQPRAERPDPKQPGRKQTGPTQPGPHRPGDGGPRLQLPEAGAESAPEDAAELAPQNAVRAPFEELAGEKGIDSQVIALALERVRAAGDDGLAEARKHLRSDRPAVLFLALRALLDGGAAGDRERVAMRLTERLPIRTGIPALEAFVAADPVAAGPEFLARILDHPQSAMRSAAARHLADRVQPATLPLLAKALDSRRSDTRMLVLDLAAAVDDPSVVHLLMGGLADPNAKVANRAAELLARSDDERVPPELLRIALRDVTYELNEEVRRSAYALLSLIEREDARGERFLTEAHVPALLTAQRSPDALLSGAAAIALATIGFRSEDVAGTGWLDLEVPYALVRLASGADFHSDFSSLMEPAVRRLSLITGESFGVDGPAWQSWWARSAAGFRARRAAMRVEPSDVPTIELGVAGGDVGRFQLLGPASGSGGTLEMELGEEFFLDDEASLELVEMLRREGVFGVERLPGSRGGAAGVRRLSVSIGGQTKVFALGTRANEPWFARVLTFAVALRDRNLWQRYPDLTQHASRHDHWLAGREAWHTRFAPDPGFVHLKRQIFAHLASVPVERRDVGLAELERLYVEEHAVAREDFDALLGLLRDELFLGPAARRLIDLSVWAASAEQEPAPADDGVAPSAAAERRLPQNEGRLLAEALIDTFGAACADELAWVLTASGGAAARQAAKDDRAFVRAVSAAALVRDGEPESLLALRLLFDDPSPDVQAAAVFAAGSERLEALRDEVLERAVRGDPVVRAAALRGAARLGGDGVKELLVQSSVDRHPELRRAAIEGLAELGDPSTAPYLVAILGRGRDDDFYDEARLGLAKMGERAWPELMRLVHSGESAARRDAALLLSEQSVPLAASALMAILTEDPADQRVAQELAVLTCIDQRERPDPANAWWEWWDLVVHDDALAWFRAALERLGAGAPPVQALDGAGSRNGALFLLDVAQRSEDYLAERARRELARMLGAAVDPIPVSAAQREAWVAAQRDRIDAHFAE